MGNPTLWYYPDPEGGPTTIDLGEGLSDLVETPVTEVADARGMDWVTSRVIHGGGLRIRLVLERFGSPGTSSLERALRTAESHLHRGGVVAFSRDSAKAWASVSDTLQASGSTTWTGATGSLYAALSSAAALASGDEIVIETAAPEHQREYTTTGASVAVGDADVTIGAGLAYTFGAPSVLRWRDFWPVLRLPSDQMQRTIVFNDHRRNFTLDVTLEYSAAYLVVPAWANLELTQFPLPPGVLGGLGLADANGEGTRTLEQAAGLPPLGGGRFGGL